MKKLLIPALSAALVLAGCSKNSTDLQAPSKVDQVFTELRADPMFLDYLNANRNIFKIIEQNVKNTDPKDSVLMRTRMPFKEQYDKLHWTGIEQMDANNKISTDLFKKISANHPSFVALTNDENKQLIKKAYAYYFNAKYKQP